MERVPAEATVCFSKGGEDAMLIFAADPSSCVRLRKASGTSRQLVTEHGSQHVTIS